MWHQRRPAIGHNIFKIQNQISRSRSYVHGFVPTSHFFTKLRASSESRGMLVRGFICTYGSLSGPTKPNLTLFMETLYKYKSSTIKLHRISSTLNTVLDIQDYIYQNHAFICLSPVARTKMSHWAEMFQFHY